MENIKSKSNRNVNIDFLRVICAFLVVTIHAPFPGTFGVYLESIARIAVPLFLMISGFYYMGKTDINTRITQVKKIAILLFLACLYYFFFNGVMFYVEGGTISDYILQFSSITIWKNFILFNNNPFSSHLWYLSAILYSLIIVIFADKLKMHKVLYYFIPLLFILFLLIPSNLFIDITGRHLSRYVVRNFLFIGLPYFCLGNLFFIIKEKYNISSLIQKKDLIYITSLVLVILSILEFLLHIRLNLYNKLDDYYITTILISMFLFLIVSFNKNKKHSRLFYIISDLGKHNSSFIYIVHPSIIALLLLIFNNEQSIFIQSLLPIITFLITLLLSCLYNLIVKKMKIYSRKGDRNGG